MAVDTTKNDIIQVVLPKEFTPKVKEMARENGYLHLSPFIRDLLIEKVKKRKKK
jgi:metal-responsive CopG/Arc/MetJ family transcriptional regulator